MKKMRTETDMLGEVPLPDDFPFGIHTWRAMHNFNFSSDRIRPDLFRALIQVKKAAAIANGEAGLLDAEIASALDTACEKVLADIDGHLPPLHPLQGGAGTSTNMAANELLANLALKHLGKEYGDYAHISPLGHVNLSQSTNDVYPTAVRIALIKGIRRLERASEELLKALQGRERAFSSILKIGRTELQDAMPLSLGQEFSAWAEPVSRFRWRLDKAAEWIREINLTGTAVGTGINADPAYSARVVDILRRIVEEPLSLARNLIDGTQNVDPLVEISGLVKTGAVSVKKLASDLRLLSSGPRSGFGDIVLPSLQAGSSIMPGKVNPVMPEAAEQVCLQVMGGDFIVSVAAAEGNLELSQFLPFIAHTLLHHIELFSGLLGPLAATVSGIRPNTVRLQTNIHESTAVATLLAAEFGHERLAGMISEAESHGIPVVEWIRRQGMIPEEKLIRMLTPEVMASPGFPILPDHE